MALLKNITAASGLSIPGAYIKVTCVSGSNVFATALVEVFASKEAANNGFPSVNETRQIAIPINSDGPSWDRQAYLHLKTLPDYADAADC